MYVKRSKSIKPIQFQIIARIIIFQQDTAGYSKLRGFAESKYYACTMLLGKYEYLMLKQKHREILLMHTYFYQISIVWHLMHFANIISNLFLMITLFVIDGLDGLQV